MHRAQRRTLRRLRNIYGDSRRDCAIILTHVDSLSHDALRVTEKKVSLLLDRESQSYLSWFIVSLPKDSILASGWRGRARGGVFKRDNVGQGERGVKKVNFLSDVFDDNVVDYPLHSLFAHCIQHWLFIIWLVHMRGSYRLLH